MRIIIASVLLLATACQRQFDPAELHGQSFDGAPIAATPAAAKLAHGERLTWVLGCRGCHGKDLQGQLWDDDPKEYGIMWASNLTQAARAMSEAELRSVMTRGVHPKREELWVMPSELFQHLARPDVDALLAYLRFIPPAGAPSPDPQLGPRALREIATGEVKSADKRVAELRNIGPVDLGPRYALGRHITRVACAECHGTRLEGNPGDTPDLIVVGGYSREEFERLITQGVPTDNRKLKELMQSVAKNRYSRLTAHERDALYGYLKARAEQR